MSTNVLLAGGSGLIGTRLSQFLKERKYRVCYLSRQKKPDPNFFQWDIEKGIIEEEAILQADYVINLAGAGIADERWTIARKKELIDSRVKTAQLLEYAFQKNNKFPKAYLSASAIGIYGHRGEKWMTEISHPGQNGFLEKCTLAWENAAQNMAHLGIRTALMRIGIVLSAKGGALPEILNPMRFGVAGYFGNGESYYSWIHIDDVCNMFIWALENEKANGVYNVVAPTPVPIKFLTKKIKEAAGKPSLLLPTPEFALRLALGEMSTMLLNSMRVSSEKIQKEGYQFLFPDLEIALKDILERKV